MDPTGAFATIVGLVCNFKSEQRAVSDDEYKEFIQWLGDKRHQDLIDEIQSNHLLGLGLKKLFNENHNVIVDKLNKLDDSITSIASQVDGFKDIANAVTLNSGLSDQAISLLQQLDESGGSAFLEVANLSGKEFLMLDGKTSQQLHMNEDRFIDDDLSQLCSLGLLIPDYNSSGSRLFKITRSAVSLVQQIK